MLPQHYVLAATALLRLAADSALSFLVLTILDCQDSGRNGVGGLLAAITFGDTDTSCRAAMRPPTIPSSGRKAL